MFGGNTIILPIATRLASGQRDASGGGDGVVHVGLPTDGVLVNQRRAASLW